MEAVQARRPGASVLAVVAGVTALAALVRFWALGRQGFWYDEATTAWLLRGTAGQLLGRLPHTESTPPLYYLFAWGWVRLFGDSEVGLRSLSALAGVLSVPLTYAAARTLAGRRVAAFAALLVAVNPFLVWYSQEARAYSLLVLESAVSLWLFARARMSRRPAPLVAWGIVAAAALCTHYFAVFIILPQAALLLTDRGLELRSRLVSVSIPALTGCALIALATAQKGRIYYFTRAPLGLRIRQIVQYFTVGFSPPAHAVVFAPAAAAVLGALLLLALRAGAVERRAAALAGTVAAGALLVPVLLAAVGVDYVNARNVIGAVVPLAVVVAAGLAAAGPKSVGLALAALLAAVSLWMVAATTAELRAQRPHWQQVAGVLAYRGTPRAILLLGARTWSRPLAFYVPRTWWAPPSGEPVREIDVVRKLPGSGSCPGSVWWGALCKFSSRPKLKGSPAPGFRFASSERVAGFGIDRYAAPRPIRVYGAPPFSRRPRSAGRAYRRERVLMVTPAAAPALP